MAGEEDGTIGLPKPPPPQPARRDAAIDAALRKFDGEAPSAATPRHRPEPWTVRRRYQLGAFATAALALVIFVPIALTGVSNDRPTSDTGEVAQPPPRAIPDVEEPPPTEAPSPGAKPVAETPAASPPATVSPPPAADAAKNRTSNDARQMAPPPVAVVESPMIPPASPPALVRLNAPPPPAPPPPPPPPPPPSPAAPAAVADRAEQRMATGEIFVTGTRLNETKAARGAVADDNAAFLRRLQARIRANDRAAVARLVSLPLRVNTAGGARTYRDRRSIERDYEAIFTPRVRRAILAQRPSNIFVRDQGAMIGNGEVWFSQTCPNAACNPPGPLRITAVNP
jgi:hypothetical protein